jgi:hypothetical protein
MPRAYQRLASLIAPLERASGVPFASAQVALAAQWIGAPGHGPGTGERTPTEVTVWTPQDTQDGIVVTDPAAFTKETVKIPVDAAAAAPIERFEAAGAQPALAGAKDVSDSVARNRMGKDAGGLTDEKWFGTEAEEVAA